MSLLFGCKHGVPRNRICLKCLDEYRVHRGIEVIPAFSVKNRNNLIPRNVADIRWIKKNGIKAWLTWTSIEQACDLENLYWWQKLAKKFLDT